MKKGFIAYQTYLALKTHFKSEKYNYFAYNKKIAVTISSFEKRNDRIYFEKLEKKYKNHEEIQNLIVSNILENDSLWIGDIFNEDCQKIYQDWKRRNESLNYNFKSDLKKLKLKLELENIAFNDLFKCTDNNLPIILTMTLQKDIMIETFCLLNKTLNLEKYYDTLLKENIIWNSVKMKYKKYTYFISTENEYVKECLKDVFVERQPV